MERQRDGFMPIVDIAGAVELRGTDAEQAAMQAGLYKEI